MSLVVDPDFIIHSLRLAYLRRIDDHLGPRVITFPFNSSDSKPSTSLNRQVAGPSHQVYGIDSHVVVAGLTDPSLHPEIDSVHSPKPLGGSDSFGLSTPGPSRNVHHQDDASSSFANAKVGSGLRYTQTIYGPGRTGALGMRVSGRRAAAVGSESSNDATGSREYNPSSSHLRTMSGNRRYHDSSSANLPAPGRRSMDSATPSRSSRMAIPEFEFQAATAEDVGSRLRQASGGPFSAGAHHKLRKTSLDEQRLRHRIEETEEDHLHVDSSGSVSVMNLSPSDGDISTPSPAVSADTSASTSGSTSNEADATVTSPVKLAQNPIEPSEVREAHHRDSAVTLKGESSGELKHLVRRRSASEGTNGLLSVAAGFTTASVGEVVQPFDTERGEGIERERNQMAVVPRVILDPEVSDEDVDEAPLQSNSKSSADDLINSSSSDDNDGPPSRPEPTKPVSMGEGNPKPVFRPRPRRAVIDTAFLNQMFGQKAKDLKPVEARLEDKKPPNPSTQELQPSQLHSDSSDVEALSPASRSARLPSDTHSALGGDAESSTGSNAFASSIGSPDSLQIGSVDLPNISAPMMSRSPPLENFGDSNSREYNDGSAVHAADDSEDGDEADRGALTARSSPNALERTALGLKKNAGSVNTDDRRASHSNQAMASHSNQERRMRGRLDAASSADQGRPKRKAGARSRSKARTQAQNEWFTSLKSDPATVASRHAQQPKVSALSAILKKQDSAPANAFATFYAGISGRSGSSPSMTVEVFFPFARPVQDARTGSIKPSGALSVDPKRKSMKLNVRKDASMEELIGYSLYCYVEEGWKPEIDNGNLSEEEQEVRLTTIGWALRIVEDGEVDDDYPAIDRSLTVEKFGGDEFAVVEATPGQIQQNREANSHIQRRPSRITAAGGGMLVGGGGGGGGGTKKGPWESQLGLAPPQAIQGHAARLLAAQTAGAPAGSLISVQGTPIFTSSALSRSAMGPSSASIFLRVLVTPNMEVRYKTTLQVPSDMYLADVLEMICKKRQLAHADEWALIVPDKSVVVPLDRTVESLQGNHDLALVKRSSLGLQGGAGALSSQSTNPNASIFKRFSEPNDQPRYNKALDIASPYKTYTVNRKTPMFVGRHERILTLDGDWIHIMPADSRAFQTKATSFHISSVASCKQSSKLPTGFKILVWRENPRDTKRYDFEAEDRRQAAEIVKEVNTLKSQSA
ncbi:hypothetical protein IE53DRAFT_362725 [Violaceomyces palustris]|uniref:Uncharacterized protein n=1 Tax=Violaceomyces palustris TaxID=1673888 RepID=A0ACD0NW22_9BASI|nr:hypothetical protein IE53DRAFT_362725 [Violaceomyces palustris]